MVTEDKSQKLKDMKVEKEKRSKKGKSMTIKRWKREEMERSKCMRIRREKQRKQKTEDKDKKTGYCNSRRESDERKPQLTVILNPSRNTVSRQREVSIRPINSRCG